MTPGSLTMVDRLIYLIARWSCEASLHNLSVPAGFMEVGLGKMVASYVLVGILGTIVKLLHTMNLPASRLQVRW
jgi:hypothetical protein